MLNKINLISFIFLVALGPNLISSEIHDSIWNPIKEKLEKDKSFSKYVDRFHDTLSNAQLFKFFKVKKYLGAGTGGVVFDIDSKDNKLVAKVIPFDDHNFQFCKDNEVLDTLEKRKVSYINKLKYLQKYTGITTIVENKRSRKVNFYACIMFIERADTDLRNGPLFEKNSIENWPVLLRFFGKLIQSFAEINFKGKVLHGDIKPDNIMAKISNKGTPPELDIEPVVIDFDLNLENLKSEDKSDKQLRYTPFYRAKEMAQKVAIEGLSTTDAWSINWRNYRYSGEFIEDSYALGVTIKEVLKLQNLNVDKTTVEYTKLLALANKMAGPKYTSEKELISATNPKGLKRFRPNMKVVLKEFLDIIKACKECNNSELTKQFIKDAKKSLDEMDNKLVKI